MPVSFIDTNVLIYLASSDTIKADRAEQTVAAGGIISVQVLNELANVARRKLRLPWQQTREFLSTIRSVLEVRPVTAGVHQAGLAVAERYGLSIYDAMIVAAALDAGCTTLWSEDMQDGLLIEGQLRVANPF
ncbi:MULTISPECIES: PIN domain-containing protein [Acidiphilium]|uniref:Ribonuclease VapC n=1 Tax=Acidiphilium rubrum TaxID=526 RepID=A0A8G2FE48_ACIRU|nr:MULTISPECIES: PIN domain-containing protein [Acidiphilium]SIR13048.1 Predicted nucleic acid-binding protein, contains PIN domain [Acidiphilium rubrum]